MREAWREIVRFALFTPVYLRANWHEKRGDRLREAAHRHDEKCLQLAKYGIALVARYPHLPSTGS